MIFYKKAGQNIIKVISFIFAFLLLFSCASSQVYVEENIKKAVIILKNYVPPIPFSDNVAESLTFYSTYDNEIIEYKTPWIHDLKSNSLGAYLSLTIDREIIEIKDYKWKRTELFSKSRRFIITYKLPKGTLSKIVNSENTIFENKIGNCTLSLESKKLISEVIY